MCQPSFTLRWLPHIRHLIFVIFHDINSAGFLRTLTKVLVFLQELTEKLINFLKKLWVQNKQRVLIMKMSKFFNIINFQFFYPTQGPNAFKDPMPLKCKHQWLFGQSQIKTWIVNKIWKTFFNVSLKADRRHLPNNPQIPTDYRHTDDHLRWTDERTDRQTLPSTLSPCFAKLRGR